MEPTAENELMRATVCTKDGLGEFIEKTGDLEGLMAEVDEKFPSTQMIAVQGEDELDGEVRRRYPRYQGILRGRIIAWRYPKGDKAVWRME